MIRKKFFIFSMLVVGLLANLTNVFATNVTSNTSVNGSDGKVKVSTYLIAEKGASADFKFYYDISAIDETISASDAGEEIIKPSAAQMPGIGSTHFRESDFSESMLTDTTNTPFTLESNQGYMLFYTTVNFKNVTFDAPGNYRYILSERVGSYDGVVYDTTNKYYIDVIVVSDENGVLSISEYTIKEYKDNVGIDVGEENKLDKATFINTYLTNDLVFTNNVSGNQIDHTNNYEYQMKVTSADVVKSYAYTITSSDGTIQNGVLTSGVETTVTLKEEDVVKIYGLSENDTYSIVAEDKSNKGYSTDYKVITYDVNNNEIVGSPVEAYDTNGSISDDIRVDYTYTKNIAAKTGVVLNMLPYGIMGVISMIGLRGFKNKKRLD